MATSDVPVEKTKFPDNYTEPPAPDNTNLFIMLVQVIEMDFSFHIEHGYIMKPYNFWIAMFVVSESDSVTIIARPPETRNRDTNRRAAPCLPDQPLSS